MPARSAPITRSPGSTEWRAGGFHAINTAITPTNETALRIKVALAPADATIIPPSAGPRARAILKLIPLSAIAEVSSAVGTRLGTTASHAGAFIADPTPSARVRISSNHGVIAP